MKRAMERDAEATARVIPVYLRDCDWAGAPFRDLQGVPDPKQPLVSAPDPDAAWAAVTRAIRDLVSDRNR